MSGLALDMVQGLYMYTFVVTLYVCEHILYKFRASARGSNGCVLLLDLFYH